MLDYQRLLPSGGTAYGLAALEGELRRLRGAREGERNNTLNRVAFSLGTLVGGGELAEATVTTELLDVAVNDLGLLERAALATIASGLRKGKTQPRSAPGPGLPIWGDDTGHRYG